MPSTSRIWTTPPNSSSMSSATEKTAWTTPPASSTRLVPRPRYEPSGSGCPTSRLRSTTCSGTPPPSSLAPGPAGLLRHRHRRPYVPSGLDRRRFRRLGRRDACSVDQLMRHAGGEYPPGRSSIQAKTISLASQRWATAGTATAAARRTFARRDVRSSIRCNGGSYGVPPSPIGCSHPLGCWFTRRRPHVGPNQHRQRGSRSALRRR